MKKIVVLLLSFALMLSTMSSFAMADVDTDVIDKLKEYGVVVGVGDGELKLEEKLNRESLMVLYSRLYGQEKEALAFTGEVTFDDVPDKVWYRSYVGYAKSNNWTEGISSTQFGSGNIATVKEVCQMMLRALGYNHVAWDDVKEESIKIGLIEKDTLVSLQITRGEAFEYIYKALQLDKYETKEKLVYAIGLEEEPVVTNKYVINKIIPLSDTILQLEVDKMNDDEYNMDFTVITSDAKSIEAEGIRKIDSDTVMLDLKTGTPSGTVNKLNYGDASMDFVGTTADHSKPEVKSVTVLSNTRIKIVFTQKDTIQTDILNTDNYEFDKDMYAIGSEYNQDSEQKNILSEVIIETIPQKSGEIYKLVVKNMTDVVGNKLTASKSYTISGQSKDTTAPKILSTLGMNGNQVKIVITEPSYIDVATFGDTSNYTINGLEITGITLKANKINATKEIILDTAKQTKGNVYNLTIDGAKDEFGNTMSSVGKSFSGTEYKTTNLKLSSALATTNFSVKVYFDSNVDVSDAQNINAMSINDLEVLGSELWENPNDSDDHKAIVITTAEQVKGKMYTITFQDFKDTYGNTLGSKNTKMFVGKAKDETKPTFTPVSMSTKEVKITFTEEIQEDSALILTNYKIEGMGYPSNVEVSKDKKSVTITTPEQSKGVIYKISLENIMDQAGNKIDSGVSKQFAGR